MVATRPILTKTATALLAGTLLFVEGHQLHAQQATTVQISIQNHRFQPAEITVPTGKPVTLRIKNLDSTPAEFESVSLRVEKVIAGKSKGVVNLRPLQPGRYKFMDDFNQQAQGTLVVQ